MESGELRVTHAPASDKPFSILLIFRSQCISRLDFVSDTICHANPIWARRLGVPPDVCGPHLHPWDLNRAHVLAQARWELPCRIPLPPQIRRFDQAFPWFADQVSLVLTPGDRTFDLPRQLV